MKFEPMQTNKRHRREKFVQRIWEFARIVLCYPTPFFFRKWRRCVTTLFSRLYCGASKLSRSVSLVRNCRVDYLWNDSTWELSSIGSHTWVYELGKITIGSNCCIGDVVRLSMGSHG